MTPNPTEEQTGALGSVREQVAQYLRDRDEALGPTGEYHTEAESLESADAILALFPVAISPQARPVLEREAP